MKLLRGTIVAAEFLLLAPGFVSNTIAETVVSNTNNPTMDLLAALEARDLPAVTRALLAGADSNHVLLGRPLLTMAVRRGDLEEVRLLLNSGARVDARTAFGRTALHEAALYGLPEIAALLISRGADVNAKNPRGETPLFYAEVGLVAGPPRTASQASVAEILREHGGVR
ncbi:MAG: ankyrin repeat domain-containing protein [Nitrospiraceae bacterium]